jgi:hypothetical protein
MEAIRQADHPTLGVAVHGHHNLRIGWWMIDCLADNQKIRPHLRDAEGLTGNEQLHFHASGVAAPVLPKIHGPDSQALDRQLEAFSTLATARPVEAA